MIISGTKDWFEFILDFSLLDRHFSESKTPEPSGCSLIIQFLYHANMTEQLYNTNYQNAVQLNSQLAKAAGAEQTPENLATLTQANIAQVELKAKRIRALRILAIKTAAILDWDLLLFEKEVPVAVMSDLLHIFLRLTLNEAETSPHSQLDLAQLSNHSIFALQLLHRWCIRTVISSKFYKKPPTKYVPINLPSSLNPLQHMKEANDSILKVLVSSVRESVEFLEKCLKELDKDVCKPVSECFPDENSSLELNWNKAVAFKQQEIKINISYDLAMYFFQNEDYKKASDYLIYVQENLKEIKDEPSILKLNVYTTELESYLIACRSVLNETDEDVNEDKLNIVGDNYTKQVVNKIVTIEKCVKRNEFNTLVECLYEDAKSCQLSNSFRSNLELLAEQINNRELQEQLGALNLLQLIAHSNYFRSYKLADLRCFPKIVEKCFDSMSTNAKANLKAFLQLNKSHFDRQGLQILNAIKGLDVQIDSKNEAECVDEEMISDSTPSSPPPSSSIVNNLNNRENTNLSYAKLSLQTCDPIILKNCITKYNFIQSNKNNSANGLRYFWPKWHKLLGNLYSSNQEAANLIITSTFLNSLLKTNSMNEMDFFFIASAKLVELVMAKKFDCVSKLMSSMEESLSPNVKNAKFFSNIQLYVNIWTHLSQMNMMKDSQQKMANQDQIVKGCKSVLLSFKNDVDVSHELLRSVFVFVLSVNEFGLLQSSEIGFLFSSSQPKVNPNLVIPNTMFNISKHLSKLCSEIPKGDKNALRKIARDLWNTVVDLFTDTLPATTKKVVQEQPSGLASSNQPFDVAASSLSSFNPSSTSASSSTQQPASRDNQILFTNRELIRKLFLSIRNGLVNSVIMSLMSTLYNVADSTANNEIFSEFRYLWPSSLANSTSLNLIFTNDILNCLLTLGYNEMETCNANWLRSYADIRMSKSHFNETIKLFLQYLICETKHFFNLNSLTNRTAQAPSKENKTTNEVVVDERIFKSIIKSCVQLNKHTQAALLYQLIPNNDYANAFRCLQESSYITPASDDMDTLYSCIWDLALLEYLCNLNHTRGFVNKKNQCLKLLTAENLNASNPPEIYQKTIDSKKSSLFLKLVEHYFLF